jgi:hypothetical protein
MPPSSHSTLLSLSLSLLLFTEGEQSNCIRTLFDLVHLHFSWVTSAKTQFPIGSLPQVPGTGISTYLS